MPSARINTNPNMNPATSDVSTFRLYLLRALYLLVFVGQGTLQFRRLFSDVSTLPFWHGIGTSMLGAMALVAAIGVRYPLQLLPLLFFEFAWKLVWVLAVLLPKWSTHQIDPDTLGSAPSILLGVIVPVVIPWRYVWAKYVTKPGDRWKPVRAARAQPCTPTGR